MTRLPRVAVVGSANVDLVVSVPRIPRPGETLTGGEVRTGTGGKSANQAVAAARLGAGVCFIGAVGRDEHGAMLVSALTGDGIDLTHLAKVDGPSGTATILVEPGGENIIVVSPGANGLLTPAHVREAADAIRSADVLGLALEVPPETVRVAAQLARDAGVRVVLNPSPWRTLERELLACVDVLVVNEHEAQQLPSLPGLDLAVTLGARGVRLHRDGQVVEVPPFPVHATDTTGCGDAFLGGLLVGLAEGLDLDAASRRGAAAGALAATRAGAQASYPDRGEVDLLLGQPRAATAWS